MKESEEERGICAMLWRLQGVLLLNKKCDLYNLLRDMKIKTTIADVHNNTKIPTLSSGSLQQHYA